MARQVWKHPDFENDLDAIFDSIAKEDPDAARRVIRVIVNAIEEIVASPELPLLFFQNLFEGVNLLEKTISRFDDYSIFYSLENDELRFYYIHRNRRAFPSRYSAGKQFLLK